MVFTPTDSGVSCFISRELPSRSNPDSSTIFSFSEPLVIEIGRTTDVGDGGVMQLISDGVSLNKKS